MIKGLTERGWEYVPTGGALDSYVKDFRLKDGSVKAVGLDAETYYITLYEHKNEELDYEKWLNTIATFDLTGKGDNIEPSENSLGGFFEEKDINEIMDAYRELRQ
jgi:hypothetical protein